MYLPHLARDRRKEVMATFPPRSIQDRKGKRRGDLSLPPGGKGAPGYERGKFGP